MSEKLLLLSENQREIEREREGGREKKAGRYRR